MPLADFTLKNDDAASVGTLKYFDAGDGKIYPVSMIYVGVAGTPTQVGDSQALPVSAASLPLPSGAATAANQATEVASLAAIQTAVELIDNTVKLADAVAGAADAGIPMLYVRDDALGALIPIEGDYVPGRVDSVGAIWVAVNSSALPSGAATLAEQQTQSTSLTTVIGHLDGVEGLLTTIDADTGSISTSAAAIQVAVEIMDDWDETNRCKVNLIVGQAGVSAGSGTVDATTQRVSIATDDAAITNLAAIKTAVETIDNAVSGSGFAITSIAAGDNNIGNIDLASAIPAGTNLIGKAAVAPDAKVQYDGATALTVKYANIDTATSGNNAIVAAVASKKIKVVSVFLAASGAVDIYWNDGTANLLGGTRKVKLDNTGAVGAGGFVLQHNATGWFETAAVNRPLNLNLSAAIGVAGCLAYVEVDA